MLNFKIKYSGGFTLIELLIWISITLVLLSALSTMFSTYTSSWLYKNRQYDIQQTARLTISILTQEMRYGTNFQTPLATVNANVNEAISFQSRKDNINYTYYIDRSDRHLYRLPGYTSVLPELVRGQSNTNLQNIHFTPPSVNEQIFILNGNSVEISMQVTDITHPNQHAVIRTTITDIGTFLR